MRRLLTFLTAAALLLVSLGIGVFTADLPFWRRALQLPLSPDGAYLPVAIIGVPAAQPVDKPALAAPAIDALVVEETVNRVRGAGSRALLVMYRGQLQIERYFLADDAGTLLPAALVARPLVAMAVGIALADHRIASLDMPVAHFLHEWDDEARGRITLRQLLEETSGLETGGEIRGLLYRSPWDDPARLPAFATSRGVRMLLGNDFESSALAFRLEHEPGGFYNVSPANPQLAAVIIERATGQPFENFIDERLWRAVGAGSAQLQLDRRAGMPAAHCCWRATARDMLRVLGLLGTDGMFGDRAVLPAGWVREMARASRVNAETGLQLSRLTIGQDDALSVTDDNGSAFWVIPRRQIAILNIANPGGTSAAELPEWLLKGLDTPAAGH
ncbi:MAG TPA: serine hydrolase [Steroidobacteraceae bacterium]|jgi:CubicO group peptidase (beta-lactamase class C family)|nr:serine hydrolase [Steroidobacteraceae bacterium]